MASPGKVGKANNVLGGAPGELGADVDQREGGDDGE